MRPEVTENCGKVVYIAILCHVRAYGSVINFYLFIKYCFKNAVMFR